MVTFLFGVSMGEIILVFLVVLLLFGANKIPEFARTLGKGMNEFRKAADEIKRELRENTEDLKSDLEDTRQSLKEEGSYLKEDLSEVKEDFSQSVDEVSKEIYHLNDDGSVQDPSEEELLDDSESTGDHLSSGASDEDEINKIR